MACSEVRIVQQAPRAAYHGSAKPGRDMSPAMQPQSSVEYGRSAKYRSLEHVGVRSAVLFF